MKDNFMSSLIIFMLFVILNVGDDKITETPTKIEAVLSPSELLAFSKLLNDEDYKEMMTHVIRESLESIIIDLKK